MTSAWVLGVGFASATQDKLLQKFACRDVHAKDLHGKRTFLPCNRELYVAAQACENDRSIHRILFSDMQSQCGEQVLDAGGMDAYP